MYKSLKKTIPVLMFGALIGCASTTDVPNVMQSEVMDTPQVQIEDTTEVFTVIDSTGLIEEVDAELVSVKPVVDQGMVSVTEDELAVDELFGGEMESVTAVSAPIENPIYIQLFATSKAETVSKVVDHLKTISDKDIFVHKVGELHKVVVGPYTKKQSMDAILEFRGHRDYKSAFVTKFDASAE